MAAVEICPAAITGMGTMATGETMGITGKMAATGDLATAGENRPGGRA